eukprot:02594.XXX_13380_13526_1 [CDS] Oithona nana genome sequencing.
MEFDSSFSFSRFVFSSTDFCKDCVVFWNDSLSFCRSSCNFLKSVFSSS